MNGDVMDPYDRATKLYYEVVRIDRKPRLLI